MKNISRIWPYFKKYRLAIVLALIASAVVSGTDAAVTYMVKDVLDGVFINKNKEMLRMIPFIVVGLFTVRCVSRFMQAYCINYAGHNAVGDIRRDMFDRIVRLPMKFFDANSTGILMSKVINDVGNIQSSISSAMRIFRSSLTVIFLCFVVFYQNSKLGVSIFLIAPALYLIVRKSGSKIKKNSHKIQEQTGLIGNAVTESFTGIRVVKSFAAEDAEIDSFNTIVEKEMRYKLRQALIMSISSPLIETLSGIAIAVIIFFGGMMVINGETTAGTFFSFLTAFGLMFEPIKKLNNYNHVIQIASASTERIFGVLDSANDIMENNGTLPCDAEGKDITFENLTFRYSDERTVLDGINLTVTAGKTVAFVGASGAGKSTIVSMVPRFYDPVAGCIKIGDTDIREYDVQSLRRNISIVSQSPFLFNNTIRYNIAYGLDNPSEEQIINAAEQAHAMEFISQQPEGLNAMLGERGCRLSGGQRQRLTIARAILMNPHILILDEATSALDTESEKIVQQALGNLMHGRTSLVIAHRLSTVVDADMIVVMDNGKIIETGTHTELLDKSPYYTNLCNLQFTA